MKNIHYFLRFTFTVSILVTLVSCSSFLPSSGPKTGAVKNADSSSRKQNITVVAIDSKVLQDIATHKHRQVFSSVFSDFPAQTTLINPGDILEITIWEVPPALFGGSQTTLNGSSTSATTLPVQMVNSDGRISIPYAGDIDVAGLSSREVGAEIVQRLKGKANQPQALVKTIRNNSATVTVVGEVNSSLRMPLTDGGERVLDALAAAGGTSRPVEKMTLQLTRGETFQTMPLKDIIRHPRHNIPLKPGDVITLLYQPLSLTALGAIGKNQEINFEAQGISLAQALGRVGGLQDNRADARGVFVFRFVDPEILNRDAVNAQPVVYTLDLSDPSGFFLAQNFQINDKDILYVSNAPAADLKKFLNMVVSVVYPVVKIIDAIPQ